MRPVWDVEHGDVAGLATEVGIGNGGIVMNWLLRFLPQDTKDLIILGQRIIASLDTPEERRAAVKFGIQMLSSDSEGGSRVTVAEWARFGSKIGCLRGPASKSK